jgi:hypothetical protein
MFSIAVSFAPSLCKLTAKLTALIPAQSNAVNRAFGHSAAWFETGR